jgi:hypothetical protein
MIRQHVVFSELMIKGRAAPARRPAAVGNHHERWDGRGYPNAREGEEIPLLGRIMALADALSAMTHDRPYRKGLTLEAAVAEIRRARGASSTPTSPRSSSSASPAGRPPCARSTGTTPRTPMARIPDEPPVIRGLTASSSAGADARAVNFSPWPHSLPIAPIGVYLHVPFCAHICPYCDFNTYRGDDALVPRYVAALCRDLERSASRTSGRPVGSVFSRRWHAVAARRRADPLGDGCGPHPLPAAA